MSEKRQITVTLVDSIRMPATYDWRHFVVSAKRAVSRIEVTLVHEDHDPGDEDRS